MRSLTCDVFLPVLPPLAYEAWTIGWGLWLAHPDTLAVTPRVGAPFCFEVVEPSSTSDSTSDSASALVRPAAHTTGSRHAHYGRYLELLPPERVRCTWVTGPAGTAGVETVLTVDLSPRDGGTHCALTHEGFASADARDRHAAAWPALLAVQAERLPLVSADTWQQLRARFGVLPDNRSMPSSAFLPTRSYPDMDAAVAWLEQVLGCTVRLRVPGDRVQLTLGNGAVVVAAWDPATAPVTGGRPPATLLVRVADVDAAWERALARGATGLQPPDTQPFGERQALVRDPAGHAWMLSQTVADVAPSQWGAVP